MGKKYTGGIAGMAAGLTEEEEAVVKAKQEKHAQIAADFAAQNGSNYEYEPVPDYAITCPTLDEAHELLRSQHFEIQHLKSERVILERKVKLLQTALSKARLQH